MDDIKPPQRPARRMDENHSRIRPEKSESLPSFKPPEAAAAEDVLKQELDLPEQAPTKTQLKKSKRKFGFRKPSKKQVLIFIPIIVLLLGGGGAAAYILFLKPKPIPAPVVKKIEKPPEPPKPTTVASPLTGVQVAPELAALPVTGVMIENSPDARPQSGLKDAGIVFEAVAEGGITRFLSLYQESQPDYVGPIRSVRPYYLEWLQGYDAAIAHVGGSPEALQLIKSAGIKDLDQFFNARAYDRVSNRYAPHNVYSAVSRLSDLGKSKGFNTSTFIGFPRKNEKPIVPATASAIDLTISSYLYNPHFDYDATSNKYKRSMAGQPHVDERSKEQLSPKTVVVMVVPYGIQNDGIHSEYTTTGSGKAFIFQDGGVTVGIWEKKGSKDPIRLGDANGSPLALNIGQSWISVVKNEGSVAYK